MTGLIDRLNKGWRVELIIEAHNEQGRGVSAMQATITAEYLRPLMLIGLAAISGVEKLAQATDD